MRVHYAAQPGSSSPPFATPEPVEVDSESARQRADAVLARWHLLGATQRRAFEAICAELACTVEETDTGAASIVESFNRLSDSASGQTRRLERTLGLVGTLEAGDRTIELAELMTLVERTLATIVDRILTMSKQAVGMVYAVDDVASHLLRVEGCIQDIERINRSIKMLSLNARIEAARAGTAGAGFSVVARELGELSTSTSSLADAMRSGIGAITHVLALSRNSLEGVATVDMSETLAAKSQLDGMLAGLEKRRGEVEALMQEMTHASAEIGDELAAFAARMQFAEGTRTKLQSLMAVVGVLARQAEQVMADEPGPMSRTEPDPDSVAAILAACNLSEVRDRFNAWMTTGRASSEPAAPDMGSTIELF